MNELKYLKYKNCNGGNRMEKLIAWSNGSYRGVESFFSYVILNHQGEVIDEFYGEIKGLKSSTEVKEYSLIHLMKKIDQLTLKNITIYCDCQSTVNMIKNPVKKMRVRNNLKNIFGEEKLTFFINSLKWRTQKDNKAPLYIKGDYPVIKKRKLKEYSPLVSNGFLAYSDGLDGFISYIILNEDKNTVLEFKAKLVGTNNSTDMKEFALVSLMKKISELEIDNISIFSDCHSTVMKLKKLDSGKMKMKEKREILINYMGEKNLLKLSDKIHWISGKKNLARDILVSNENLENSVENFNSLYPVIEKVPPETIINKCVSLSESEGIHLDFSKKKLDVLSKNKYSAWSDASLTKDLSGKKVTSISYVILNEENKLIEKYKANIVDGKNSGQLEAIALILLMKKVVELNINNIDIFSDCASSINQIRHKKRNKKYNLNQSFTEKQLNMLFSNLIWKSRNYNIAHNCFKQITENVPTLYTNDILEHSKNESASSEKLSVIV
jgi:ribonuclease HI